MHHEEDEVGEHQDAESNSDQEQSLSELGDVQPIVIVVLVEVVVLHFLENEGLVGQNHMGY